MKKKLSMLVVPLVMGVMAGGCSGESVREPEVYNLNGTAMGTLVTETIYTTGENPASSVLELLTQTEDKYLSWREEDSDIGKANLQAGQGAAAVNSRTMEYLEETLQLSRDSGGAFDPTMGQLTRLWDVEAENPQVPSRKKIKQYLKESGYEKIHLSNGGTPQVELEEGAAIDLGAVGKGIGCDEAAEFLQKDSQVQGAVVAVGGSVFTLGSKPDQSPWKVAVRDPRGGQEELLGILNLEGETYVSTSGDYEKYFIQEERRYHHILDPFTGYPADAGLISATVVGQDGLISDGLSTACFVLGMEKGAELLEKYHAEGIFVDEKKQVYVTDGLMENFELSASGYVVFPLSP